MKAKLTSKLSLQIVYIIILILALINPHYTIANNVTTNVPRGGLPVLAKSFPTDPNNFFNSITSNGTHLFCTSSIGNLAYIYTIQGSFVKTFGSLGSGNGQFHSPGGILYANGHLYVADQLNNRIEIFTTNGIYLSSFGSSGTSSGQFSYPYDIEVYSKNIYITDVGNNRVEVFDFNSNFIRSFGSKGTAPNQFENLGQLAIVNGRIYIPDFVLNQVKVWDTSGNFLFQFSNSGLGWNTLSNPVHIAASNNFIYVGNYYLNSILVFDLNGNYQCEYNGTGNEPGDFYDIGGMMIQNSILYGIDVNGHQINEFVFLESPYDLHANSGLYSISLTWQRPLSSAYIEINSYQIFRSTDGQNFTLLGASQTTYFTDTSVIPGVTYYYKVTALAQNAFIGVSDYSNTVNSTLKNIGQNNNESNSSSSNGGFLPFDTTFMIFSLCMVVLLVRKKYKSK